MKKKEGSKRKTTFEKKKVSSRFAWVIDRSGFNIGQSFTLFRLVNPPDQSEFNNYT
jgi:glucose-6-phosphate-specific signal transduction histidine kinase